jgi:hypothetical protein
MIETPSAEFVPWTDRRAIVNRRSNDQDKPSLRMRQRNRGSKRRAQSLKDRVLKPLRRTGTGDAKARFFGPHQDSDRFIVRTLPVIGKTPSG